MAEGFQTQLSETANKRKAPGDPLLEAFLDPNGRLAFRFIGEGGTPVAQPRVTTPGFVPPSLGITPPASATPTPPSITPQASGVATGAIRDDRGGGAEGPESLGGPLGLQNAPASRATLSAIGMLPGFGLATGFTSAMQALGIRGVTGGVTTPRVGTSTFQETVRLGDIGRAGFVNQTVSDPTGSINRALAADTAAGEPEFSTALSMRDLDNMSSSGTEGGGISSLGGSAGDFEGISFDGRDDNGGSGGLGRGESPTGGDVEGTPF